MGFVDQIGFIGFWRRKLAIRLA